jgi:hypothetical protein
MVEGVGGDAVGAGRDDKQARRVACFLLLSPAPPVCPLFRVLGMGVPRVCEL